MLFFFRPIHAKPRPYKSGTRSTGLSHPSDFKHPSRRVMEKRGMTLAGDFDHPNIEAGLPLRHHVVYEIAP